jgi:hypothetical protein
MWNVVRLLLRLPKKAECPAASTLNHPLCESLRRNLSGRLDSVHEGDAVLGDVTVLVAEPGIAAGLVTLQSALLVTVFVIIVSRGQ